MNEDADPGEACEVILVDPDRLFREALSSMLQQDGFHVVRSVALTKELEQGELWGSVARPRLLVIDMTESTAELRERLPRLAPAAQVKLVGISRTMSSERLGFALELGFHACLTKDVSISSFEKYVRLVLSGESIFPIGLAQTLFHQADGQATGPGQAGPDSLTSREYVVLGHLMQGASNKLIARHVGVSDATIKVNVKNLFRKIDVRNRTEAAAWAVHKGIPIAGADAEAARTIEPYGPVIPLQRAAVP